MQTGILMVIVAAIVALISSIFLFSIKSVENNRFNFNEYVEKNQDGINSILSFNVTSLNTAMDSTENFFINNNVTESPILTTQASIIRRKKPEGKIDLWNTTQKLSRIIPGEKIIQDYQNFNDLQNFENFPLLNISGYKTVLMNFDFNKMKRSNKIEYGYFELGFKINNNGKKNELNFFCMNRTHTFEEMNGYSYTMFDNIVVNIFQNLNHELIINYLKKNMGFNTNKNYMPVLINNEKKIANTILFAYYDIFFPKKLQLKFSSEFTNEAQRLERKRMGFLSNKLRELNDVKSLKYDQNPNKEPKFNDLERRLNEGIGKTLGLPKIDVIYKNCESMARKIDEINDETNADTNEFLLNNYDQIYEWYDYYNVGKNPVYDDNANSKKFFTENLVFLYKRAIIGDLLKCFHDLLQIIEKDENEIEEILRSIKN